MSELQTTVTAVAVYPDRARVTRSGTVTLEVGVHRLEVVELPLSLDAASVRASARGTARARLLGVDVRRQFYAQVPTQRVRELEGQVEALQDEMGGLDAQVELLKREQAALGELAGQTEIYARGLAFGKTTAEAHMTLLDRLRARADLPESSQLSGRWVPGGARWSAACRNCKGNSTCFAEREGTSGTRPSSRSRWSRRANWRSR